MPSDYTIQCHPPEPSYRLLTALRLLDSSASTEKWEEIVRGERDEDDLSYDDVLAQLCCRLRDRWRISVERLKGLDGEDAFVYVRDCLVRLLEEEGVVASALLSDCNGSGSSP